jgi:uncharacterized repeat protein (TIGR01451 family)
LFGSSNTTITIVVSNRGPSSATNVILSDPLPGGFSLVSAQWNQGPCSVIGGVVTCNLGILTNSASATATIVAKAILDGTFTNTATASSSTGDPVSGNNSASTTLTVNDNPNVPLLKITQSGDNVVLAWSTNATGLGFVLQAKADLSTNTAWANVTNVPVTVGQQSIVTNALSAGPSKNYRLFKPN